MEVPKLRLRDVFRVDNFMIGTLKWVNLRERNES